MTKREHRPGYPARRAFRRRRGVRAAGGCLLVLGLLAGCAQIVAGTPERVSVDTRNYGLGDILPGMRRWMGWLAANEHCAAQGKSPELEDMKDTVVVYRCVPL
jgi:hypothetical protein